MWRLARCEEVDSCIKHGIDESWMKELGCVKMS